MIHSKSHKYAFTLIEALFAMTIAGIVLSPIFIMFGTISNRVNRAAREFDILLLGKNMFFEGRQKQDAHAQEFSLESKDKDFDVDLRYSLEKSEGQQSIFAQLPGLHKEMVTISWQEQGQKRQEKLITYVYKKPEQKKT
jgi:type II secretory pathway pseudopilin PulG